MIRHSRNIQNISFYKYIIEKTARRLLPRSLLSRSLIIITIPLIIIQIISITLFYGNFISTVSRRLSDSLTNEISFVVNQLDSEPEVNYVSIIQNAKTFLSFNVTWHPHTQLDSPKLKKHYNPEPINEFLHNSLKNRLNKPYTTDWDSNEDQLIIYVQLVNGLVKISVPKKRMFAGDIWLFIVWVVGSGIISFLIAGILAWVQYRAIRHLSKALDKFGKGRDPGHLMPVGSKELRRATAAFNVMRERIQRFIKQRTVILASVSHDLRTPLTRLRLSLAMIPQTRLIKAKEIENDVKNMISDIEEMEHMISGYLSFARGEGTEELSMTDVMLLVKEVIHASLRSDKTFISINLPHSLSAIPLRAGSIRRVLNNILDNAQQHGGKIKFSVMETKQSLYFIVEDDGPGIPYDNREEVFIPFKSHSALNGSGLGLAIAKNIIQSHGGDIILSDSLSLGGLKVHITLPK